MVFFLHANISHNVWMGFIVSNSSCPPHCHSPICKSNVSSKIPRNHATGMGWRSKEFVLQNPSRTNWSCGDPNSVIHLYRMPYSEEFCLMNCLFVLTTIEFHVFICNVHPSCINNLPLPLYVLHKFVQNPQKQVVLSFQKAWWQGSSQSWDSRFLNNSNNLRKPWMKPWY